MMCLSMRKMAVLLPSVLVILSQCTGGFSFGGIGPSTSRRSRTIKESFLRESIVSEVVDAIEDIGQDKQREQLKRTVLQLGASYDRGFAASPRARSKMDGILRDLELLNKETDASRFIDGPQLTTTTKAKSANSSAAINGASLDKPGKGSLASMDISPLTGNWRMVWTTAQDVLLLGANPVVSVGAIYQFISPPTITNVIDFMPRFQNFLPPSLVANSMARAEVTTKASSRKNNPNRVGLNFERVALQGKEVLGQDVSQVLPPLGFDLPRIELSEDVGYFDVTYLDSEMLVIRQNAPGGCFVLVNVDTDTEP
jgi:hypothetical protein